MTLTKRQAEVLRIIEVFAIERGYGPSLREIAAALGIRSVSTVHQHVDALRTKGRVTKRWNEARSIEPITSAIMLLERLPAGTTLYRRKGQHQPRTESIDGICSGGSPCVPGWTVRLPDTVRGREHLFRSETAEGALRAALDAVQAKM